MESSRIENRSEIMPVPVYVASSPYAEEEVNLVGLWRIVVRRKALVLYTMIACLLVAGAYLVITRPVYRATVHLMPPQQQNIQGLLLGGANIEGLDTSSYTPEFVYKTFLANLKSQSLRREYFDSHNLVNHYVPTNTDKEVNEDQIFNESFSKHLEMQFDKKDPSFVSISFSGAKPELVAQWLNEIVTLADKRTINQLSSGVDAAIRSQISKLEHQMASKLELAKKRRMDQILELKEALRIAKVLGIQDASTFPKVGDKTQAGLAVNTAQVPLYMRGTDALETEISVLASRESDEPFIRGFRDLQERAALLKGFSVDRNSLSAVTIDALARIPYRPASPNYWIIVMLAGFLGSIAAVFAAFVAEHFSTSQSERDSLSDVG